MEEKIMRKNKKILLTVLLIVLIISVNVINAFALDDGVSPLSVHVHSFVMDIQSSSVYNIGDENYHMVSQSGYLNCTTCYHSEPFDREIQESHDYRSVSISTRPFVYWKCIDCGYIHY